MKIQNYLPLLALSLFIYSCSPKNQLTAVSSEGMSLVNVGLHEILFYGDYDFPTRCLDSSKTLTHSNITKILIFNLDADRKRQISWNYLGSTNTFIEPWHHALVLQRKIPKHAQNADILKKLKSAEVFLPVVEAFEGGNFRAQFAITSGVLKGSYSAYSWSEEETEYLVLFWTSKDTASLRREADAIMSKMIISEKGCE